MYFIITVIHWNRPISLTCVKTVEIVVRDVIVDYCIHDYKNNFLRHINRLSLETFHRYSVINEQS